MSAVAAVVTMAAVLMAATGTSTATASHGPPHCDDALVSVREQRVESDGAEIAYSFFLPHREGPVRPVPAVLHTHGSVEGRRIEAFGTSPAQRRLCTLLSWGYAVLTFDQRGFNDSSGVSQLTHPAFEGRDFMALVDLLASDTEVPYNEEGAKAPLNELVRQDAPGDPRVGAYSRSLGGAAVAIGASVETRVDALVLFNTWGDLRQATAPQNVPKRSWVALGTYLSANNPNIPGSDAATGLPRPDTVGGEPELLGRTVQEIVVAGKFSDRTLEDLWRRSPLRYALQPELVTRSTGEPFFKPIEARGIQAPTLLVQSPNDVLFPPNQLLALHEALRSRGVPVGELWYCSTGEHGGAHNSSTFPFMLAPPCRSATADERTREQRPGDAQLARIDDASRRWLARYLDADPAVDTGPRFELQLQDATWQTLDELPPAEFAARWSGSVDHRVVPTSGYALGPAPAGCTPPRPAATQSVPTTTTSLPAAAPPPPAAAQDQFDTALWCPVLPEAARPVPGVKVGDVLLGVPRLRSTMTAPAEDAILFVRLLEVKRLPGGGHRVRVLGEQDSPMRVSPPIDGGGAKAQRKGVKPKAVTMDLPAVAWRVAPETEIFLEVATSSNAFTESRSVWSSSGEIKIDLPVLDRP